MDKELSETITLAHSVCQEIFSGENWNIDRHNVQGKISETFRVDVGAESFILRIAPSEFLSLYRKEHLLMEMLGQYGIPSAQSQRVCEVCGKAVSVQTLLQGELGKNWLERNSRDASKLWESIGREAARVNAVKVTSFGADFVGTQEGSYHSWWEKQIGFIFDSAGFDSCLSLTSKELVTARNVMERAAALTFEAPVLCHGDLSPENVIVVQSGNNLEVSLIDWGLAEGHVGLARELIELVIWGVEEDSIMAFLNGSGAKSNPLEEHAELVNGLSVWRLLSALAAMSRFEDRGPLRREGARFRSRLADFI